MEEVGVLEARGRSQISFSAKIEPVEKLNDEFLKCRVSVCALGKNRNKSHISKESADEAEYSLAYTPVIGHLYEGDDDNLHMGGHDMTVQKDKSGRNVLKSLCVPYGVVPKDGDVRYEEIVEPNGVKKTYITSDCILWIGRFPELLEAAYSADELFNQSMEINVLESCPLSEDKSYTDITKYTYSALCLLGRSDEEEYNVEPCFPESKVSAIYEAEEDSGFAAMFAEMKKNLSECFSGQYCGKEEGTDMEDEKTCEELANATAETADATAEALNADGADAANLADAPDEAATATDAAIPEEEPATEEQFNDAGNSEEETNTRQFTYVERMKALCEVMPNDDDTCYWVADFDDAHVYVHKSKWTEDGYSEETGRFGYLFDESTKTAQLVGGFEKMFVMWLTEAEKDEIESMRAEYSALKQYKETREVQDKENAFAKALEEFEDLAGISEFDAVSENRNSFSTVEELVKECYAIRGKYGVTQRQKSKGYEPSVGVKSREATISARERMHQEYGKR